MKTGVEGKKIIKYYEGLHDGDLHIIGLQPKMDPVKIWTEGWGRAMRDSKGNFIKGTANKALAYSRITIKTIEQADKALNEDLLVFEKIVNSKIKIELTQNQFDALVSYTYNTGGSATLFKLINNKSISNDIRKWFENHYITGQGSKKPLTGLVTRRKAEANLFFKL
jgi:lysozyme